MRILHEDENQLVFAVYPTKYFLAFMIFLILLAIYALFHPELITFSPFGSSLNWEFPVGDIAGTITTIALIIVLLGITIASYLIPIRVAIDKIAKTITYRYLTYAPIIAVGESMYVTTKVISINNLDKLVYTNNIPEIPRTPIRSAPHALAKYRFMLKDNSSIDVYAGFFSIFPHRYAFTKIAEYLKIPYENDLGKEISLAKSSDQFIKKSHLIKILLFIFFVLILILVLFLGTVFLIIFLRQMQ